MLIRDRMIRALGPADDAEARNVAGIGSRLAASLGPDGRWPDIDYGDQSRSEWKAAAHLLNLLRMAVAYRTGAETGRPDAALKQKTMAALRWWLDADPQNPNWWHNQIGTPKLLGEAALFLGEDVPADALPRVINTLKRSDWSKWTGQNLVWGCENQIVRGILARDPEVVSQGFARMYEEVRTGPPAGEGVMPDFSFHQHGAQFYSGGYGLNFACDVGAFIAFGWGTAFQAPTDKMALYTRYVLDGEAWMTRGNTFDYSATGREITRKGKVATPRAQKGITLTTIAAAYHLGEVVRRLAELGVPRREEYAAFAARLEGRPGAPPLSGNRHYWCSDYMAHQRPQFFASVRMFSSRLVNTEIVNDEGKRSHHLADGCTFVYRSGDEYRDIFPAWDWSKVPGTTAEVSELSPAAGGPRYKTDAVFVGGVSDGTYGLAAQELRREHLRARKAWMMLDEGFVALGAGINCDSDRTVVTSVNQCLLRGPVVQEPGADFVWHDGVAYIFPARQKFLLTHGAQTGRWSDIGVGSDKPVTEQVFSLWVDHGVRPGDVSYVYVVMPGASVAEAARRAKNTGVEVLSNTSTLQAVRIPKLGLIGVVFWSAGRIGNGRQSFSVDQPCLLMVQERGKRLRVSVANPLNEPAHVKVTVGRRVTGENAAHTAAGTALTFDLPGGPAAGSTVVREFQTD
jgi:chondroitin AC lyase